MDMVRMTLAPPFVLDYNSKKNLENRIHKLTFAELSFKLDKEPDLEVQSTMKTPYCKEIVPSSFYKPVPIPPCPLLPVVYELPSLATASKSSKNPKASLTLPMQGMSSSRAPR